MTSLILVQAHILANTALLAWATPDPACEGPGDLGMGVGLKAVLLVLPKELLPLI